MSPARLDKVRKLTERNASRRAATNPAARVVRDLALSAMLRLFGSAQAPAASTTTRSPGTSRCPQSPADLPERRLQLGRHG
jgi:hypothetical protein